MTAPAIFADDHYDRFMVGIHAVPARRLDGLISAIYEAQLAGDIEPVHAERLHQAATFKREVFTARRRLSLEAHTPRVSVPPPADRRSTARCVRRKWSTSGALPPGLREHFTAGEHAIASVIRDRVRKHGVCDLSYGAIAKRAGLLGKTVVKRFVRVAKRLDLVHVQERPRPGGPNDTNIITIVSPLWRWWNDYGASQGGGGTDVSPHENRRVFKKEERKRAGHAAPIRDRRHLDDGTCSRIRRGLAQTSVRW